MPRVACVQTLDAHVYLLFTPSLCVGDPWATLDAAIDGGVDAVQWRVKVRDADGVARARAVCRSRGVAFVVDDDVALAIAVDADGAHVGQEDMPAATARAQLRFGQVLGVSTHDTAQIAAAQRDGADHVGFGPCFPTTTKGYTSGQSDDAIRAAVRAARVPLYAIGGIDAANVARLLALGVRRIAVSSAILRAHDPRAAAAELRRQVSSIASPNE